jgi:hypothetical protein
VASLLPVTGSKSPQLRKHNIAVIPGDGIGEEIMPEGIRVLRTIAEITVEFQLALETFPWGSNYFLSNGTMMLEFLGEDQASNLILSSIKEVTKKGDVLTPDLVGNATTFDVGDAIAARLAKLANWISRLFPLLTLLALQRKDCQALIYIQNMSFQSSEQGESCRIHFRAESPLRLDTQASVGRITPEQINLPEVPLAFNTKN